MISSSPFELLGWILLGSAVLLGTYTFGVYPLSLWMLGRTSRSVGGKNRQDWPTVSVTVPAYNEEAQIADTVESLLRLDYPRDKLQLLIVSDGSTDRTDEIVSRFEGQGVELLRVEERRGKTFAENVASSVLRGEFIVNTDASIRLDPGAIKALIPYFDDPTVGLASGRDISVGDAERQANVGESRYVGFEMGLRRLETRFGGIVGASGSLYAIRRELHGTRLPEGLSRDFAAALVCIRNGFRAVSVDDALCVVPRTPSLRREYSRKVRTVTRGMETLWYMRAVLNPFRFGRYSWMLFSHKVCRWLIPVATLLGGIGVGILGFHHLAAAGLAVLGLVVVALGFVGWSWPEERSLPRILSIPAFALVSNLAVLHAWVRAIRGDQNPIWEPTRRDFKPARS